MSKRRTERLLNLLMCLLAVRRPVTREQVRAAIDDYRGCPTDEAFARMFERDKEELRAMGVPLTTVAAPGGETLGYRVDAEDYALPPLRLGAAERSVLALAARMWQQASLGPPARRALSKLEAAAGPADAPDAVGVRTRVTADPALLPLMEAVREGRSVRFAYRRADQEAPAVRHVEPWGVLARDGRWYLVGHDADRGGQRVFRLSRITGPVGAEGPPGRVQVPPGVDLAAQLGPDPGTRTARLLLAPGHGQALRRRASAVRPAGAAPPDGPGPGSADEADVPFSEVGPFAAELAGLGASAVVVAPEDLRARVLLLLRAAADRPPAGPAGGPVPAAPARRRGGARPAGAPASAPPAATAAAHLSRLLALVPWLVAHDGVTVDAAAAHFGVRPAQLEQDLELLICCGLPGGGPDQLVDIQFWDDGGKVHVIDPQTLDRPLRLTPEEALALLMGLRLLAAVPGDHDRAALGSAAAALREAAGDAARAVDRVAVDPGVPDAVAAAVQEAVAARRALRLEYVSAGRDARGTRTVDPMSTLVDAGRGYLVAWCRTAAAVRVFRLDRVVSAQVLPEPSRPPAAAREPELAATGLRPDGPPAVVDVSARASWVVDHVHADSAAPLPGGGLRLVLPVADPRWAVRLLLQLGDAARVRHPAELDAAVRAAARAGLAAYGRGVPGP